MNNKDILLYISEPYKRFRWISVVSVIQVGFALVSVLVMPTQKIIDERQEARAKFKEKTERPNQQSRDVPSKEVAEIQEDQTTLWARVKQFDYGDIFSIHNVKENLAGRPYLSIGILGATSVISFALHMYARRVAHRVSLLPNERIRFESFSPLALGKPPSIEVPARDISCVSGRKSANNYAILKLRNYWGYHLIHKTEGTFLQPKLYDEHLGYKRSWHK